MKCKMCYTENSENAHYCKKCGDNLTKDIEITDLFKLLYRVIFGMGGALFAATHLFTWIVFLFAALLGAPVNFTIDEKTLIISLGICSLGLPFLILYKKMCLKNVNDLKEGVDINNKKMNSLTVTLVGVLLFAALMCFVLWPLGNRIVCEYKPGCEGACKIFKPSCKVHEINNNDSSQNTSTTNPITDETNSTSPIKEKGDIVLVDGKEIFKTSTKNITINGKEVSVSFKYYILKEKYEDADEAINNLYYDVYLNDKIVDGLTKLNVFYDECDENDNCELSESHLNQYTNDLTEPRKIVDNNNKEYVLLLVNGGSPIGSHRIFIINNAGETLLYMFVEENLSYARLTGTGSEKYMQKVDGEEYDLFVAYNIMNDKIYYLEAAPINSESEMEGLSFNEHVITINNGKINNKTTGSIIKGHEASGGASDFVTVYIPR